MCNPGILGTQSSFRRLYEEPIVRGQQPDASSEEKLLGQTRAAEVAYSDYRIFFEAIKRPIDFSDNKIEIN